MVRRLVLPTKRPPAPLLIGMLPLIGILRRTVDDISPLNGLALLVLHLRCGLRLLLYLKVG